MAKERPPFDPFPRAITPLAEFDARPRAALSETVTRDRETRDTDITELAPSGEHEVHVETDDETPPDGPFAIRQVLAQLKKFEEGFARMGGHCETAANNSIATTEAVKALRAEFQELKKEHGDRLVRLELDRLWVPRAVSTIALLISLATAFFVFVKLR